MSAQYTWPPVTASNPSVGGTGITAPTSATEIGGVDSSGDLIPIAVNPDGTIIIDSNLDKNWGPVGADTLRVAAELGNEDGLADFNSGVVGPQTLRTALASDQLSVLATEVTVSEIDGKLPATLGQTVMADSFAVAIASDQTALPLSPDAATATNQATEIGHLANIETSTGSTSSQIADIISGASSAHVTVDNFPGTQPISGTVTVVQPTGSNLHVEVDASALPAGAATSALQTSGNASLSSIDTKTPALGQTNMAGSSPVVIASNQSAIPTSLAGRALANAPTVTTYGTPITSAGYTTIVASTTSAANLVEIFDSSGVALYFATGAAASEVNQFVIYPGGNGQVPLAIPAGTRISYKAVSTSASGSTAYNVLNLYT